MTMDKNTWLCIYTDSIKKWVITEKNMGNERKVFIGVKVLPVKSEKRRLPKKIVFDTVDSLI